ncbi:hypothetical protein HNQ00_003325, partial [Flavobacterium sp. 14A]|nr:hypothetical protein [Flavobacterium sp. 14A]
ATMTYTVKGSGGCDDATATRVVTVTAAPDAGTLSGTQAICVDGTTTLSSTTTGGTWSTSAAAIATINASTGAVKGLKAGTATMTYTVKGSGGCDDATATRVVTVNQLPVAPIVSAPTQPTCSVATGSVKLSGLPSGNWTITPGNYTGNTSDYTITGLSTGKYKFTVTNSLGCSSSESVEVTINVQPTAPAAPIAKISVQPKCGAITGTVLITSAGTGFEYNVDGGNYQTTTTFSNLTPGTHKFTVRNAVDKTCVSNETTVVLNNYICAEDDTVSDINGTSGSSNVGNVLTNNGNGNDTLNGVGVSISQVNLTVTTPATSINGTNVPFVNPATGIISVPAGTAAGQYKITYEICEKANPTNCDTAVVTVNVKTSMIDAVDDTGSVVNGLVGGTALTNVLVNDQLNNQPALTSTVNVTFVSSTNAGVTLDGTSVKVAAGTPAGEYVLIYRICEKINPNFCDDARVTVKVTAPKIDAVDDKGTDINGSNGGTTVANV